MRNGAKWVQRSLATQTGDDSITTDAGTAAEMQVPGLLRVVALVVGWEQNRHG
jgi:hypothetical protein